MIKWKPDSVEWTGARHGQGKPILKRHSIKGVKLEELEELAHTPSIASAKNLNQQNTDDKFLKIVKNITSKGFVRSNYEEKLVDLSDVRINLKTKN